MFGQAAAEIEDPAVAIGYHPFQAEEVEENVRDVVEKLDVRREHRLLEIGFGTGLLLLPLAEIVREAVGVDHPLCVARLWNRKPENVTLVSGHWPQLVVRSFDRILAYNSVQYQAGPAAAAAFVEAAVQALAPGGALLLGALPNRDAALRFSRSEAGRAFSREWEEQATDEGEEFDRAQAIFRQADPTKFVNDDFIFRILTRFRARGYQTYVLPHRAGLPHHHTREDVLIRRP